MPCLICHSENLQTIDANNCEYYQCLDCDFIFLDPKYFLSSEDEKKRYLLHNNDVKDPAYQDFVRPLVDIIDQKIPKNSLGLDFGSGSAPILAGMLKERGYEVETYDPFFSPAVTMQPQKFDFIATCEVVEHLKNPIEEFKKLKSYLQPNGHLVVKTHLWSGQNLNDWYYSRDPTHVSFYSRKNLEKICESCGYAGLEVYDSRVFTLVAKINASSISEQNET